MLREELIEQADPLVGTSQQKVTTKASNDVHRVEFWNPQFFAHILIDFRCGFAGDVPSQPMFTTRHSTKRSKILLLEESAQSVSASEFYAIDSDMRSVVGWQYFLGTHGIQSLREQGFEHRVDEIRPIQWKTTQNFRRNAAIVAQPSECRPEQHGGFGNESIVPFVVFPDAVPGWRRVVRTLDQEAGSGVLIRRKVGIQPRVGNEFDSETVRRSDLRVSTKGDLDARPTIRSDLNSSREHEPMIRVRRFVNGRRKRGSHSTDIPIYALCLPVTSPRGPAGIRPSYRLDVSQKKKAGGRQHLIHAR